MELLKEGQEYKSTQKEGVEVHLRAEVIVQFSVGTSSGHLRAEPSVHFIVGTSFGGLLRAADPVHFVGTSSGGHLRVAETIVHLIVETQELRLIQEATSG